LRAQRLLDSETLLTPDNFAVDYALCPEQVITEYIARLIDFPEALQVLEFCRRRLALVGRARLRRRPAGRQPDQGDAQPPATRDRRTHRRHLSHGGAITPTGETVIEDGDEVFVLAADEHIRP
jgi:trk system potassium uptake protein TrkA